MIKENTYPLTERESNEISHAVRRGLSRMVAAEGLMDFLADTDSFELTLEGIMGTHPLSTEEQPQEAQEEAAYRWLVKNYDLISATFTAVRELVNDTRGDLEMLSIEPIEEYFLKAAKERIKEGLARLYGKEAQP